MANEGVIGRETIANALNYILNKCGATWCRWWEEHQQP